MSRHYNLGVMNPNYLGKYVRDEMREIHERIEREEKERAAQKRIAMIHNVCGEIGDQMTPDEYNAWWEAAPEDKFLEYAEDYLLLMKFPPMEEGTEPSPIISGGEVLYPVAITSNAQEIPF